MPDAMPPNLPPPLPPPMPAFAVNTQSAIEAELVDYESPFVGRSAPSSALYWLALTGWGAAAGGGLFLFLAYLVTHDSSFAVFAFLWIYVGGLLTFAALVLGIIYGALALSAGFPPPAGRRRALLAWLLPLSNVVFAIIAFVSLITIISASTRPRAWTPNPGPTTGPMPAAFSSSFVSLQLTNPSPAKIETAALVLPTGKRIDIGPIGPGAVVTRTVTLEGTGSVMLNCTQRGDVRWSQTVLGYITDGHTTQTAIILDAKQPMMGNVNP